MATLNPKALADMNTAFAEHFDGIAPRKGLTQIFAAGANLQDLGGQLAYTGPAAPQI